MFENDIWAIVISLSGQKNWQGRCLDRNRANNDSLIGEALFNEIEKKIFRTVKNWQKLAA